MTEKMTERKKVQETLKEEEVEMEIVTKDTETSTANLTDTKPPPVKRNMKEENKSTEESTLGTSTPGTLQT
jgi:hypothetical protein